MTEALAEELRRSLAARRPWFDGLQGALADRRWTLLERQCGLDRRSYRTARVRASDASTGGVVAGQLRIPTGGGGERAIVIEVLERDPARPYVRLGFDLAGSAQAGSKSKVDRLNRALLVLAGDPEATAVLDAVLWALHVITPETADYDVSCSDPEVPFSIFIGVPDVDVPHGDLRLAEGVLHECLHLLLSLVEDVTPLVTTGGERHFSPWQATMRPAQGVLHGTYVFALLGDFLRRTKEGGHYPHEEEYLSERIATCADDVAAATRSLLSGCTLTSRGRELVNVLATI